MSPKCSKRARIAPALPAYLPAHMKARWKRVAWAGVGIFSLIWLLAFTIPPLQSVGKTDLDSSWGLTLHEAFARHMRMGENLAFNYGPWGFTFVPICHPDTFFISIIVTALWGCGLFWSTWRIARGSFGSPFWACIWLLCLFRLGTAARDNLASLTLVSLTICFFHFEKRPEDSPRLAGVLGAMAALALLSKFSVGIAGLGCVAIVSIALCSRRQWPWSVMTFAASLPLLWMAASQHFSDLVQRFASPPGLAKRCTPQGLRPYGASRRSCSSRLSAVTPWRAFRGPPNLPRRTAFQKSMRTSEMLYLVRHFASPPGLAK